jgi:hypothetical protein
MWGWMTSIVLFLLFALNHSRARFWKRKHYQLSKDAVQERQELKAKIDMLEARR